jgi:hypothetical protein
MEITPITKTFISLFTAPCFCGSPHFFFFLQVQICLRTRSWWHDPNSYSQLMQGTHSSPLNHLRQECTHNLFKCWKLLVDANLNPNHYGTIRFLQSDVLLATRDTDTYPYIMVFSQKQNLNPKPSIYLQELKLLSVLQQQQQQYWVVVTMPLKGLGFKTLNLKP